MKVASASVDITPVGIFWMEGYIHPIRKQPGIGVHDTPRATLLLLEVEGVRTVFVSLDVCILKAETTDAIRSGLAAELGMASENIVINSIHSHSCANGFEGVGSMGIPTISMRNWSRLNPRCLRGTCAVGTQTVTMLVFPLMMRHSCCVL